MCINARDLSFTFSKMGIVTNNCSLHEESGSAWNQNAITVLKQRAPILRLCL